MSTVSCSVTTPTASRVTYVMEAAWVWVTACSHTRAANGRRAIWCAKTSERCTNWTVLKKNPSSRPRRDDARTCWTSPKHTAAISLPAMAAKMEGTPTRRAAVTCFTSVRKASSRAATSVRLEPSSTPRDKRVGERTPEVGLGWPLSRLLSFVQFNKRQ